MYRIDSLYKAILSHNLQDPNVLVGDVNLRVTWHLRLNKQAKEILNLYDFLLILLNEPSIKNYIQTYSPEFLDKLLKDLHIEGK